MQYFAAIILICIFSALFSDFPLLTLKRTLFQLIFIQCVMLSFFSSYKRGTTDKCIQYCIYIFLALVLLGILKGTAFNLSHALAGFNFSKNRFCINLMVLLCLYCITRQKLELKINIWLVLTIIVLVVLSRGKTMIVAVFLLLPLLAIPNKSTILRLTTF